MLIFPVVDRNIPVHDRNVPVYDGNIAVSDRNIEVGDRNFDNALDILYLDYHEMGSASTYYFEPSPPFDMEQYPAEKQL
jgi:hypothetical protein